MLLRMGVPPSWDLTYPSHVWTGEGVKPFPSLSHPRSGLGRVPHPARWGYPPLNGQGYPAPCLPDGKDLVPPVGKDGGTPPPPQSGRMGYTAHWCEQTDRRMSNYYLPSSYGMRALVIPLLKNYPQRFLNKGLSKPLLKLIVYVIFTMHKPNHVNAEYILLDDLRLYNVCDAQ